MKTPWKQRGRRNVALVHGGGGSGRNWAAPVAGLAGEGVGMGEGLTHNRFVAAGGRRGAGQLAGRRRTVNTAAAGSASTSFRPGTSRGRRGGFR
jgi:hypothetical protein